MAETYTKKEVVDGKVVLTKTVTNDISKEKVLNRLTEEEDGIQSNITRLQQELVDVRATIAAVNKITVSSGALPT